MYSVQCTQMFKTNNMCRKGNQNICFVELHYFLMEKQIAKKQHRNDPCLKTFEIIQ